MKLIDVVNAHIAAVEMGQLSWPYDMALALVKVKKSTKTDVDFFVREERELVMQYAALDESGNVRLTPNNTFIFKDPAMCAEYERNRAELGNTEAGERPATIRVKAPAEIKPAYIEALDGFIEFSEGN